MNDLERFKNFYKNPNQEDYNYFKAIIKAEQHNYKNALKDLLQNLDFDKNGNTVKIIENYIDFDSLDPIVQKYIEKYIEELSRIQ